MSAPCATLASVIDALPGSRGGAAPPALTADEIARLTGGRTLLASARPVRGAAVDSRLVEPGNLFVALPGERTDGHEFVIPAAQAGAATLLVARAPSAGDLDRLSRLDVGVVLVGDALRGLHAVAAGWRARFAPLVVGVTGSIAKTSVKEASTAVLARRFTTLRSEGNQNNEIGLPLTVLRIGPEHEAAVLEMGMYVGGEIADLARIARPRIGVVTAVQGVHLSRIGSLDAIERAKGELVEALPDAAGGGVAVLNADDERVRRMATWTRARPMTYGFGAHAEVTADAVVPRGRDGMGFLLVAGGERRPVALPVLGRHGVHNALAAAAVGLAAGLPLDEIVAGLEAGWSAPHRATIVPAGDVTLLDDTYNASPGSVAAALDLLATLTGRRVAVLGEMLELGAAHDTAHRAVGEAAARVVDLLVVVGPGATGIADGAASAGLPPERIVRAADRDAALAALAARLRPGDVVLVKGSRGAALDALVERLREELG